VRIRARGDSARLNFSVFRLKNDYLVAILGYRKMSVFSGLRVVGMKLKVGWCKNQVFPCHYTHSDTSGRGWGVKNSAILV